MNACISSDLLFIAITQRKGKSKNNTCGCPATPRIV